jgi:serine/threonine-protein kinase HipA
VLHVLLGGIQMGDLDGTGNRLRFRYNPDAQNEPAFVPLSTGMPSSELRWRGGRIRHWLQGLLPERDGVLRRWRAEFGLADTRPESLLAHVGEDVAGAAQFVRPDRLDAMVDRPRSLTTLSTADLADLARAASRDILPYDAGTGLGRFSLAGAQAKFALQQTDQGWALPAGAEPSTHIFKPAIAGLADQDVSEVLSMRAAARIGLPTARAFLADFDGQRVIGVERYDRARVEGRWLRVHQENLCQAAGLSPLLKYESQSGLGAGVCAGLIRQHCGNTDVATFAQAIVYNYLIRGSDAHAQNYSILIAPGGCRLAPLYDINTTLTFGPRWATTMAMSIGGESQFDRVNRGAWDRFARDIGVDPEWLHAELRSLSARLPDALTDVRSEPDLAATASMGALFQDRLAEWLRQVRSALGT